jgi:hypothetical protein
MAKGNICERVWIVVDYSRKDDSQAGHVLYQVDFAAPVNETDRAFTIRNKFRLSNLAHCG